MTLLEPTAILKIESTAGGENDADDGAVSALAFRNNDPRNPSGIPFEATIQTSAHDEGGIAVVSASVRNIPRNIIGLIPPGAIVRIEAGYRNSSSIPVGPIFTGTLDSILPSRSGRDVVWDIQATSNQTDAINYYVPLSEEEITVGDLLDKLAAPLGLKFNYLTEAPFDPAATYASYTTEGGVLNEIQSRIIPDLRALTGKPGITALPSPTNPFQIDIWDVDQVDGIPTLNLNLDSPLVYSSGLSIESGPPSVVPINVEDAPTGEERSAINQLGAQTRLSVTRVFDPRIYVGLGLNYRGRYEGSGTGVIDEVNHSIGRRRWETQFAGKVQGGD